jgi:hypothetical protein
LSARKFGMGISVLAGLLVAGIVGIILEILQVPLGTAVGSFLGGVAAAWLLFGQRNRALTAGFIVGLFSFPVQLMIFTGVVSSGLYTPPPVEEMPQDLLLAALGVSLVIQVITGAVGGLLGGILHHPPSGTVEVPRPYIPPPPPHPEKYCVQCGAGLAKETLVCPACSAKQP